MIGLLCLFLVLVTAPCKSKSRLEAENAALRHQYGRNRSTEKVCASAWGSSGLYFSKEDIR